MRLDPGWLTLSTADNGGSSTTGVIDAVALRRGSDGKKTPELRSRGATKKKGGGRGEFFVIHHPHALPDALTLVDDACLFFFLFLFALMDLMAFG